MNKLEFEYLNMCKKGISLERENFIKTHSCKHSQFGDCKCYVKLDSSNIGVDKCILKEINYLIENGVETLNSCCGHKILTPSVLVNKSSVDKMIELGYERINYHNSPYPEFILKMSKEIINEI